LASQRYDPQRGNPAAKLDASAAIQQKRYDASWGKSTITNKFVTYQYNYRRPHTSLAYRVPEAVHRLGVSALN
jgi:hypothetical protein